MYDIVVGKFLPTVYKQICENQYILGVHKISRWLGGSQTWYDDYRG